MYYVVRRAFRNKTGPLPVGSIVEPTGVENFKYRCGEKHIVQINEQNYARYADFFKERFGISIPNPNFAEAEEKAAKEAEEKAAKEAEEKAAKAKAQPEAKHIAKIVPHK